MTWLNNAMPFKLAHAIVVNVLITLASSYKVQMRLRIRSSLTQGLEIDEGLGLGQILYFYTTG